MIGIELRGKIETNYERKEVRSISIQIQPNLSPSIDMEAVANEFSAIAIMSELVASHSFDSGDDNGKYFNYTFEAKKPLHLWREIQSRLYEKQELAVHMKKSSMAMCSDEDSWDDYLQLFHFDPTVPLDSPDELLE